MTEDIKTESKLKLYKRLLGFVKPYWPAFVVATLGNLIYSGVDSFSMYLFKPILDKGFIAKDVQFLQFLPWIVIILFFLRGVGGFFSSYAMDWVGRQVVLIFRRLLFAKYLKLPAKFFDQHTSGDLLAKLTYHVEQVTQATNKALTTLVRQGFLVLGLLTVMVYTNWKFTLILIVVLPVLVVIIQYVSKRFRKLSKRIQNAMGDVNQITEETLTGYKEVRMFSAQKQQAERFEKVIHYNFVQEMKMTVTNALSSPVVQFIGAIVLAGIIYLAVNSGAHMMSAGSFVTLLSCMLAILKPAKDLTNINSTIQRALAAAEDVFETLDREEEVDQGTIELENPVKGAVTFEQVSFEYLPDKPTLRNINLAIQPGEMVALIGRSGAGKSSLVNLLTRFYVPTSGRILVDDYPIEKLTLHSLRHQIAMVSQHVVLFDDSVMNNVAFGERAGATEEDVIDALKAAYAWDFVRHLPEGLHTRIGENGLNLSGGQRQRLAIARAILSQAPILILDEATSALDNESERAIQSAIFDLAGQCTSIVIAHRLSTIRKADRIVVMDQGEIVEVGSHDDLVEREGHYADLLAQQR